MEAQAQAQGLGRKKEKVALEQGPQGQGGRKKKNAEEKEAIPYRGVSVLGCLMPPAALA